MTHPQKGIIRRIHRASLQGVLRLVSTFGVVLSLTVVRANAGVGPTLGNYPATSVQLSTNATITPDAAPANATSMTVSSSTNFKGKLEGDPATGVVRVTNAHPAGNHTITVRAFGGSSSVTHTFTLTVGIPATCNPVSFAVANFQVFSARSVGVGDFNGDGKQDLAVAQMTSGNNVAVFLGNGAGSLGPATNFHAAVSPISLVVSDFNGDGKEDLAVANNGSGNSDSSVSILIGNGTGGFSAPTNFLVGGTANSAPLSIAVGDFNGDGKPDLVSLNFNSSNFSILLGDGAGGFSTATNRALNSLREMAVGDFNGDGKQDLAIAGGNGVDIFLGNGAGGFGTPENFSAGIIGSDGITVGDFNGDGKQDLATTDSFNSKVLILLGDGTGRFGAPASFSVPTPDRSIVAGDFNGDGNQDVALLAGTAKIMLGDGAGGLGSPSSFTVGGNTGSHPLSLAVGDFNGDGKQDLATANNNSGNASILLRDCALTPPPTTLANISTRLAVGTGDNVLIGGSIITGTQSKRVIVRAIGPSLPVPGALVDPILELHKSDGAVITNDNWGDTQGAEITATGLAPANASESAILVTLPPGGQTAILRGKNNTTGVAVVEVYDLDRVTDPKLANISTRGAVETGDNVMIGGTIITGSSALNVLLRAIGPSLGLPPVNVPNALQDPILELYDGNGAVIVSNDNWRSDQEAVIQATGLAPTDDRESAIFRNLQPGNYTAIVKGSGNATGVAVVEAYQLGN